METTTKFSTLMLNPNRIRVVPFPLTRRENFVSKILASNRGRTNYGGENYYEGKLVNENMIVLRMRIKEMKLLEKSDVGPPSNWMEWEKQCFLHYNEDVCEGIGLLQNYLMNVRPSLALGIVVFLLLSVTISTGVFLFGVLDIAKGILSAF